MKLRQYLSWFLQAPRCSRLEPSNECETVVERPAAEAGALIDRLRALAGDLVCIHDADGRVEDADTDSASLASLTAADLIGDGLLERVHIADRPLYLDALSRARHGAGRVVVEFRLDVAPSGETARRYAWLEMTASSLAGATPRAMSVCRDIGHHKAREEELRQARQAAEDANEAKTRFLHSMSHELRTPLNAIIGFSEMMAMPGICVRDERQMNEYAGIVHNSGKHLLGLIDEVLDMSRLEAGKYRLSPETFGVADLVRHAVELVQHEMEAKGVRLSVREFDAGLVMTADRRVCRQVLVNLLAASIKAAAPKERLRLRIDVADGRIGFCISSASAETRGERRLSGGLLGALATLIGGEVRQGTADTQDGLEVRLPLVAGTPGADNVVRLHGEAVAAVEPARQLSA